MGLGISVLAHGSTDENTDINSRDSHVFNITLTPCPNLEYTLVQLKFSFSALNQAGTAANLENLRCIIRHNADILFNSFIENQVSNTQILPLDPTILGILNGGTNVELALDLRTGVRESGGNLIEVDTNGDVFRTPLGALVITYSIEQLNINPITPNSITSTATINS